MPLHERQAHRGPSRRPEARDRRRLTEAMVAIEGENMRSVTSAWSKRSTAATGMGASR